MTKVRDRIVQVIQWCDQEAREAVGWAKVSKGFSDQTLAESFEAGFRQGYLKAYGALKLHGMLKD